MRKYWLILGFVVLAALFYQLGARQARIDNAQTPTASASQDGEFSRKPVRADRKDRAQGNRNDASRSGNLSEISYRDLPKEAVKVLGDIASDGPYNYPRDGVVFQNRERILPQKNKGYYREFTVKTPGSKDRGARRIVTGGRPATEWYYTDDHYRSFAIVRDAQEVQ